MLMYFEFVISARDDSFGFSGRETKCQPNTTFEEKFYCSSTHHFHMYRWRWRWGIFKYFRPKVIHIQNASESASTSRISGKRYLDLIGIFSSGSVGESNWFGCCGVLCADLRCKFKLHLIEGRWNSSKKLVRFLLLQLLSNIIQKLPPILKLLQPRIALVTT